MHCWTTALIHSTFLLTLSPPIPLKLYTLPYWSNPPFLIFDIRALWRSVLSARKRMSEIKTGGLDQYGVERFKQWQFGTAGVEGVKRSVVFFTKHNHVPLSSFFVRLHPVSCEWRSVICQLLSVCFFHAWLPAQKAYGWSLKPYVAL